MGADRTLGANNSPSMIFKILLDGEEVFNSGLMKYDAPIQFVSIDLEGARELKLVVNDSGNGNWRDHAAWADTKFLLHAEQRSSRSSP